MEGRGLGKGRNTALTLGGRFSLSAEDFTRGEAVGTVCALWCCVHGEVGGRHGLVTDMFPTHSEVLGFCSVKKTPIKKKELTHLLEAMKHQGPLGWPQSFSSLCYWIINSVIRPRSLKWGDAQPMQPSGLSMCCEISKNRTEKMRVTERLPASWLVVRRCGLGGFLMILVVVNADLGFPGVFMGYRPAQSQSWARGCDWEWDAFLNVVQG